MHKCSAVHTSPQVYAELNSDGRIWLFRKNDGYNMILNTVIRYDVTPYNMCLNIQAKRLPAALAVVVNWQHHQSRMIAPLQLLIKFTTQCSGN